jgi:hypothetical protein
MMTQEREYHDVANIFPMMTGDEFKELCDDIREHGQQLPIVLIDEKILDGRNRYLACLHVGVEPEFVQYTGDDPVSYALSANLKRRHLAVGQLAKIATDALPVYKKEAERRKRGTWTKPGEKVGSEQHLERLAKDGDCGPTHSEPDENANKRSEPVRATDQAGKAVGISGKSVQRYGKLKETASPEVLAAVESGEMSLGEAANATSAKKPKPDRSRKELLKDLDSIIGKAVRTVNLIGTDDVTGKKAFGLLDGLCKLIVDWK